MATPKRLTLKTEKVEQPKSGGSVVVSAWVDTGVFHLDQLYSYRLTDQQAKNIAVGSRIEVPFNGRECEALVVEVSTEVPVTNLKYVSKMLSSRPLLNENVLQLIKEGSINWGCNPYDIVRSAIPPRVASVEKEEFATIAASQNSDSKPNLEYRQFPAHANRYALLAQAISESKKSGSVLAVLPEERDVVHLVTQLDALGLQAIILDSHLSRADRYRNFLRAGSTENAVVVGTRSAIFAPLHALARIFILNEQSELLYEPRTPGWNVRDLAKIRSSIDKCSVTFVGYSPSLEVAAAINRGEIQYLPTKGRVDVSVSRQSGVELLPGKSISTIRSALKSGPVLFISPSRGYALAISCSKCRNIAHCECGGKLSQPNSKKPIHCVHCLRPYPEWRCSWCQNPTPYLLSRGAERHVYEIGAAFPGVNIQESNADHLIDVRSEKSGICVATPGAIPFQPGGYSLVVLLQGDSFIFQSDLRAVERVREVLFSAASLTSGKGKVLFILNTDSSIVSAIGAWNPMLAIQSELSERDEVHLPPFTRAISLDIDSEDAAQLARALEQAKENGLLPKSTSISNISETSKGRSRILLRSSLEEGALLVQTIHQFQKKRSLAKKKLASLRIDPYSLSL